MDGAKLDQSTNLPRLVGRVIQLTDCHLGPTLEYCLAGVRTENSFREVLARMQAEAEAPDMVMATGDISAHGKDVAYQTFTRMMDDSGFSYAWLPGNHDDFSLMQEGLHASPYWPVLELGDWRLISLNTAVHGKVEGRLTASELAFLANCLAAEKDHPTLLFMHHPPMDIGCAWLDRQQVANGRELAALLKGYDNIKGIFTGHVHQMGEFDFGGIPLYTTPSTCFQFTPNQQDFAVDTLPPGYRWIDLFDDGRLATGVVWIDDTAEVVDTEVNGY